MAPTASTTATMAIGDALAVVLSKARNFKEEDYALFHPGGSLGRRLLTVEKVMYGGEMLPLIGEERTLQNAIVIMTGHGNHGAAFMVDDKGTLTGIVTDGDLRRILEKHANPLTLPLSAVMTKSPKSITPDKLAGEALHLMETKNITVLPVVETRNRPVGIVHLHDIIKGMAGLEPRI
jgi:arabinose-5-phosphate isomerase